MSEAKPETGYRTTPVDTDRMPPGISYIIGNEAAERFSFYGMRTILIVFMTQYLVGFGTTETDVMTDAEATSIFHLFVSAVYFTPLLGAFISDAYFGKYRTIIWLSIVYCLGHIALALDESRVGLFMGLSLIAIGSGGIKPCVSSHVGDQFGAKNQDKMTKVFGWFYLSINLGAFLSTLLTPWLLREYGPSIAFGVPGALMILATIVFWLGRNDFAHIPPSGQERVVATITNPVGLKVLGKLITIFVFVSVFWSLFDQSSSKWVLQAFRLDREVAGVTLLPSQIQATNPLFILLLVPIFSYLVYPGIERVFKIELTPLRKIGLGLFLTVPAFALPGLVETWIEGGSVFRSSSSVDARAFPSSSVIDPDINTGWVGRRGKTEGEKTPDQMEIVLRLKEYRAHSVGSVVINPTLQAPDGEKLSDELPDDLSELNAERVAVSFATSPKKEAWSDPQSLDLDGETTLTLDSPVEAQFVRIQFPDFGPGEIGGLQSVRILDAEGNDVSTLTNKPSILWQILAYLFLTAAEVMVSITVLEFAYTQAPRSMKSLVMSLNLLAVAGGNLFTSAVNTFIQKPDGTTTLEGANYYWFFTGAMLLAAVIFVIRALFYRYEYFGASDELDLSPTPNDLPEPNNSQEPPERS